MQVPPEDGFQGTIRFSRSLALLLMKWNQFIRSVFSTSFNKVANCRFILNAGMAASVMLNSKAHGIRQNLRCFYSDNTLYKIPAKYRNRITAKINFNHSYIIFGPQIQYSTTNLLKNKLCYVI